ncbi:glycosyltransferase involved in cell wall biosynthesis [Psychrobacillus insolitus]|uniref:Glycosyltransferase involved in cell wall biosynthesis n=1 Tax=Psychrobacillus insolitus TaxID=1461 RepID=A0A2W7N3P3_9BACI|nr:glycosyltransferase family 4 protein [Psychrobacillus insolitus]PZX05944.1 glycosyltransferase involved in cell wall biosynthesis [Psychrobacillus insolitus]
MKIAYLVPTISNFGGIERVTSLLTNQIALNDKYDITVISYYYSGEEVYEISPRINKKYIYNYRISLKKGIYKAVKFIREDIDIESYDILVVCGSIFFPIGVLGTMFKKTKLILWEHTHYYGNSELKLQKISRKGWVEFADAIITLTDSDRKVYLKKSINKKVYTIPNPLDPRLEFVEKKKDIHENKIISVGRLTEIKNFEECIEVADILLKKYSNWTWDIYGEGNRRDHLNKLINIYGLEKKVNLMGNISNIYEKYNEYKIFVSTSKSEGFGLAILESMAMGVPVISYDVPYGPSELIDNGKNGYLIPFKDKRQLLDRIETLMNNNTQRNEFAEKGIIKAESYNLDEISRKWGDHFNKLMS